MRAARVTQPGDDRIMLAMVSRKVDKCNGHARSGKEGAAHFEAVVGTPVDHQNYFVSSVDRQFLQRPDQFGDRFRAIINRDHD